MVDVCGRQKLVSVFLEMNDAVRNGYQAPPVSNGPRILRQVPLRLFQLETAGMVH
jgi:hypothetical protein